MRKITEIIIHCTATPAGRPVTVADVDRWHRSRGFASIGYHYLVALDGTIHRGRPVEQVGAHCLGHNACSIGVAYVGGLDRAGRAADTRTPAQKTALRTLIHDLQAQYPGVTIHGHNEFANKSCPCFPVQSEYPTKNQTR